MNRAGSSEKHVKHLETSENDQKNMKRKNKWSPLVHLQGSPLTQLVYSNPLHFDLTSNQCCGRGNGLLLTTLAVVAEKATMPTFKYKQY